MNKACSNALMEIILSSAFRKQGDIWEIDLYVASFELGGVFIFKKVLSVPKGCRRFVALLDLLQSTQPAPLSLRPGNCLLCQGCHMSWKDAVCLCALVRGCKRDKKSMLVQSFSVFMYINIVEPLG